MKVLQRHGQGFALGRSAAHLGIDIVQAHMWYDLAAEQVGDKAQNNRDLAASEMTPAQIAEAQRMAREWMAKHQQ